MDGLPVTALGERFKLSAMINAVLRNIPSDLVLVGPATFLWATSIAGERSEGSAAALWAQFAPSTRMQEIALAGRKDATSAGSTAYSAPEPSPSSSFFSTAKVFEKASPKSPPTPSSMVSATLLAAFEDAVTIRRQTGGKDDFIGIRHVLFAILTALEPSGGPEAGPPLDIAGALEALKAYILEQLEPGEDAAVWRRIFSERSTWARPLFALLQADNPYAADIQDRFGARDDARAFAMTVCARTFDPPMAVGVFGAWGSGKTYFLRLVQDEIAAITREAAKQKDSPFLSQVAPIRFNAWHYAETNLWASLVDHIFTRLAAWNQPKASTENILFDRLNTARELTLASAQDLVARRAEQKEAAAQAAALRADLAEARSQSRPPVADFWKRVGERTVAALRNDPTVKVALRRLGLDEAQVAVDGLKGTFEALSSDVGRVAQSRAAIARIGGDWRLVAVTVLATFILGSLVAWLWPKFAHGPALPAIVAGFVTPGLAAVAFTQRAAHQALATLQNFRHVFDAAVAEETKAAEAQVRQEEQRLAAQASKVAEAEARLAEANARLLAATTDYNEGTGRGRLLKFVRDRAQGADYTSHLSLVATVRRDFEELSDLLEGARKGDTTGQAARAKHKEAVAAFLRAAGDLLSADEHAKLSALGEDPGQPAFERVVLYIDDLDRCSPDQVVAVLQAIHLLLAFPLFVVFVAVDLRWLKNSLTTHYKALIGASGASDAMASAGDYLEKIFQTPYWVRPMHGAATRDFLSDRLGAVSVVAKGPSSDASETSANSASKAAASERRGGARPPSAIPTPPPPAAEAMLITPDEQDFIKGLAEQLGGSPRRALRFLNVYRIIKASLSEADRARLERDGYPYLLTLLAVGVGPEGSAAALHRSLRTEPAMAAKAALEKLVLPLGEGRAAANEKVRLKKIGDSLAAAQPGATTAALASWATFAARFDFEDLLEV